MRAAVPTNGPRAGGGSDSPTLSPPTLSASGPALAPAAATERGGSACLPGGKASAGGDGTTPPRSSAPNFGSDARPARRRSFWTDERIADIQQRLRTSNLKSVAHDLGLNPQAIRGAFYRRGLMIKTRPAPGAVAVLALRAEGLTWRQIAKRLHLSVNGARAREARARKAGWV